MASEIDELKESFKEEASELLAELEASLLELEERPDDADLVNRVFRAMHTIKGSAAMLGFDDISSFAHEVETFFDLVRSGKISVTKELINLTLSARDQVRLMFEASDDSDSIVEARSNEIIDSLKKLLSDNDDTAEPVRDTHTPSSDTSTEESTFRISFQPPLYIYKKGIDPISLLSELRKLGHCNIIAKTEAIPDLENFNPEVCYIYWNVILTTKRGINEIKEVFIFIEDDCELKIDVIGEGDDKKIGEILVERGDLKPEDIQKVLGSQKRIGEMLVEAGAVDSQKVESALVEQQHVREKREEQKKAESISSIRVPSHRLDSLVDLVGELVTVQARLSQNTSKQNEPELLVISEEVERLTGELRDKTMSIRMLPIRTIFSKFRRLVRDLSKELGKEIEMTTEGEKTELDKTMIEQLNDPMIHLILNSIDHGIEPPEVREASKKPRKGTVHLSAVHSGSEVLIKIKDDGKGLDREAIKSKAVEKGLIALDAELPEKELLALIFAPGFSTSKKITGTSGRGVGMDVVKRSIDSLRGSIEISSQEGAETTITLKLPLTLAIIEGLLVMIGDEYFILPLSAVEECVEFMGEEKTKANGNGRHLINVRGELIPYINLREQFATRGDAPEIEQIVINNVDGSRVGFVVDKVIGEHQTVIKALGRVYRDIKGVSGATILGDGTVALILDVPKLVQSVEKNEMRRAV